MKKMTCRDMGGACDAEIQGETAEEMMENGKKHVHEQSDEGHQGLVKEMENATEEERAKWEEDFKGKFAAAQDA